MAYKKTYKELQDEIALNDLAKAVRAESDKLYAIKMVEKIVFGMVALILIAVATAIVALVLKK